MSKNKSIDIFLYVITALAVISILASWADVLRRDYYLKRETATTDGHIVIRNLSGDNKHGYEVLIYYEVDLQRIFSECTIQKKDLKTYYPRRKVKIKFSKEHPEINRIIMFYDSSENMSKEKHEAILKDIESTK